MSPPPQKDGDELSKDLKTQEIKNFTCGLRRSEGIEPLATPKVQPMALNLSQNNVSQNL